MGYQVIARRARLTARQRPRLHGGIPVSAPATSEPRFGLYFYAWYSREKWAERPIPRRPAIGLYDSADPAVIAWQAEQIAQLGVDYVIFEMVSSRDWCFARTMDAVRQIVPRLAAAGIGYSFMLDVWVDRKQPHEDSFEDMLGAIRGAGLLEGCVSRDGTRPMLLAFGPDVVAAIRIRSRHPELQLFFPVWIPSWGSFGELREALSERGADGHYDRFFGPAWDDTQSVAEVLAPLGYLPLWQDTAQLASLNGFAPVVPGYDDSLLERPLQMAPTLLRDHGRTLVKQFCQALRMGASDILIYSWNEYFEGSDIEPSREHGDALLMLARDIMATIRRDGDLAAPAFPVLLDGR
jgi:hypothetical protein